MKSISTFDSRISALCGVVLLLALAGCGLSSSEKIEAQMYATLYARDHTIPPTKYLTLAAQYYGVTVPLTTPTPSPNPNWTPTMSFLDFSGTQVAQQQSLGLTQQAAQMQLEREKLAAEEKARREAEEAKAAQETAIAYSQQQTAEARVFYAQQTAYAESTMVMRTAEAAATSTMWAYQISEQNTAVAAAATAQVLPTHAIWTQDAVHALATIEQGEADKVSLAVRRQQLKNVFDAYLPWLIVVGGIIILARGFGEYVKTRVHSRDEHGAVPLIQMKADNGDTILVKPEDLETGVMKVQKDGAIIRYAPMDEKEQSDIKRRNQAVEAIRALPTPYAQTGAKIVTSEFSSTRSRVTIGNPAASSSVMDEADRGFMEEAKND